MQRVMLRLIGAAKRFEARYYQSHYQKLAQREIELPALPLSEIQNILVFKPDDIGDTVYGLFALQELKKALPTARVSLLCKDHTRALYEAAGLADEIVSVSPTMWLVRFPRFDLGEALKKFGTKTFDLAIYLRTYPDAFRYFKKVPAKFHLHPLDPRMRSDSKITPKISLWQKDRHHQALLMTELLSPILKKKYSLSEIQFPKIRFQKKDEFTIKGEYFLIHPFSRTETRQYPLEDWERVVAQLGKFGLPIYSIGGKGDPKLDFLPEENQLQGKTSLMQSVFLISKAKALLCGIGGPAHLASLVETPAVLFFGGESYVSEWGPLGRILILRGEVPCAPCLSRTCLGYGLICMKEISSKKVLPEVLQFLEGLPARSPTP